MILFVLLSKLMINKIKDLFLTHILFFNALFLLNENYGVFPSFKFLIFLAILFLSIYVFTFIFVAGFESRLDFKNENEKEKYVMQFVDDETENYLSKINNKEELVDMLFIKLYLDKSAIKALNTITFIGMMTIYVILSTKFGIILK